MSSQSLMVRDDGALRVRFTPDALATKEAALGKSGIIARVSTAEEQAVAVEAQRDIRAAISAAEKSRKEVKDPVLEFGRAIDNAAKEYKAELEAEEMRLAKLVGDFQQLEIAKAKAAEAARRLEQERIEAERQAELRRIAREEAERVAELKRKEDEAKAALAKQEAEAQRLANEAKTKADIEAAERKKLELEAERKKQAELQRELDRQKELAQAESLKAMESTQERFNAASADVAEKPTATPARAAGQRVAEDWEVTINDVHTLARCHPNCVRITPLVGEIKALLKLGAKVQGVTVKEIVKSTTRAEASRVVNV